MVAHHFTVDVEEYFHVSALEPWVPRSRWSELESRVGDSLRRILDLLEERGHRGTFFVLGWLAERRPGLVREIAERGHEVASHGWGHQRVTELEPNEFQRSVRRSRELLEEITGQPVIGYRAPSFSIVPGREWALDVLVEEGYRYDSSLYPVRRPGYGHPDADPDPFWLRRDDGWLGELPPATLRFAGLRLPAGGGAYFRVLPYALVRNALEACERRGVPGTFYIHPWEIDPDQPRFDVPLLTRFRHYGRLDSTRRRLERLLDEFSFRPVADTVTAASWPAEREEPIYAPSTGGWRRDLAGSGARGSAA